jgi:hypothetical protein
MREDDLLAMQPRAFAVTTGSEYELEVYLNVASRLKSSRFGLGSANQNI